jgi:hypothetical protein
MNKRRIDEILKCAFGELDGDLGRLTDAERSELEKMRRVRKGLAALKDVPECQLGSERLHAAILGRMTDAERSEHERMQVVHDGMRALKDVPECQLSNERLKDAILGSAVRPRRISAWSVATAGVACAAIALIALRGMGGPLERDMVVVNDPASTAGPLGSDNASSILGEQSKIFTPPSTRVSETSDEGGSDVAVAPVVTEPSGPEFHKGTGEFGNLISNRDLVQDPEVAITPVALTSTAEREVVVVVDPDSVTRNGAAKATEMDSYSNVVFGG